MTWTIPNIQSITNGSNGFDAQTIPDFLTDDAIPNAGDQGTGVLNGCGVTPQGSPNMTVQVAAGNVVINGLVVPVASVGSLSISAADATDRKDIVVVNNAGTVSVTNGTDCGTAGWIRTSTNLGPVKAAIPANSVVLAEIYIEGSGATATTAVAAINIVDKTYIVNGPTGAIMTASQTVHSTAPTAITALALPLLASQNYRFECELFGSNSASGSTGISVALSVPTGATIQYGIIGNSNSSATKVVSFATVTTAQSAFMTAATFTGFVKIVGAVIMSTATGSLQVNFASQTGTTTAAGTATMNIGSNMIVFPI